MFVKLGYRPMCESIASRVQVCQYPTESGSIPLSSTNEDLGGELPAGESAFRLNQLAKSSIAWVTDAGEATDARQ